MPCNKRNLQEYHLLVDSCAESLFRFALRMCGCRQQAEDLVQETYLHAWNGIDSLRDASRARAWIFSIMRRRFATQLRNERIKPDSRGNADDLDGLAHDDSSLSRVDANELVQVALSGIPEKYREPLLLVLMEGFSVDEVSEVMSIPRGTVLTRVSRGKEKLRLAVLRLQCSGSPTTDYRSVPDSEM